MEPDVIPPTIELLNPSSGLTGVPVNTNIAITFSEAMIQELTQNAFTLYQGNPADNITVTGTITWDNSTDLIFYPAADLQFETLYIIQITTAATDLSENNLTMDFQSTFTTEMPGFGSTGGAGSGGG